MFIFIEENESHQHFKNGHILDLAVGNLIYLTRMHLMTSEKCTSCLKSPFTMNRYAADDTILINKICKEYSVQYTG